MVKYNMYKDAMMKAIAFNTERGREREEEGRRERERKIEREKEREKERTMMEGNNK